MENALITSSTGILFILAANAGLWFFLEKKTGWKLFHFIPPALSSGQGALGKQIAARLELYKDHRTVHEQP